MENREIFNLFYQDGYRIAARFLGKGISRETISGMLKEAYQQIDGLLESFVNRCGMEGKTVDCRKGCAWCCRQAVLVSAHEALLIHEHLMQEFPPEARRVVIARNRTRHEATRNMRAMAFLHYMHSCPFLHEDACSIYPVRPMACRIYLSASASSCKLQHDQPMDRLLKADLYQFPLQAGRGTNEGMRACLLEKKRYPSEWLLEAYMASIFEDPSRLDAWLEGQRPFGIRELDKEENEYLRELGVGSGD